MAPYSQWGTCENCGKTIDLNKPDDHECKSEEIEKHLTNLFNRQFITERYSGDDSRYTLRPFSEWLETTEGKFAVFCAQRDRQLARRRELYRQRKTKRKTKR